ncbi:hypothetical protein BKA57DRAFT_464225, partial [Linnemannia elongata]
MLSPSSCHVLSCVFYVCIKQTEGILCPVPTSITTLGSRAALCVCVLRPFRVLLLLAVVECLLLSFVPLARLNVDRFD